ERATPLAAALAMPVLARAWQMLLKGLEEVQTAPQPAQAAAMVLVRLAYVAELPAPVELVRALTNGTVPNTPSAPPGERIGVRGQAAAASPSPSHAPKAIGGGPALAVAPQPVAEPAPSPAPAPQLAAMPQSFAEV